MMNSRIAAIAIAAVFCLVATVSGAEEKSPRSGAVRIGYVDFNKALNSVSDGREVKKRLEDEFREKQQQLDQQSKSLVKMREALDKDRMVLSDEDLKQKEEKYRSQFYEVQQMLSAFRKEMETREANLTKRILEKLRVVVSDIGSEGGYDLILEKSQDVVVYAPSFDDLTERVVSRYNGEIGKKR